VNLRCEFTAYKNGQMATGGRSSLFVNDKQVAEGRLERTVPVVFTAYVGMDIGRDSGEPVSPSYLEKSAFPFTGSIGKVAFELDPR